MTIEKRNATYTGVKEVDGKIVCEKCGKSRVKVSTHLDYRDYSLTAYNCECGNVISVKTMRDKDDVYWGCEE